MSEESALLDAFKQADSPDRLDPSPAEVAPQQDNPDPSQGPQTGTEPAPTPLTPAEKRYLEAKDDDLVKFKVNGQVVEKPWKEILQTQALLPSDYTRKTQALAEERKTFSTERAEWDRTRQSFEQERQQLAQALQDPAKIEALYLAVMAKRGGQAQPAQGQFAPQQAQPARIPTPDEIAQLVDARVNQFVTQQETQRVTAERANVLEKHVESILTSNPALRAIPNVANFLYGEVTSMVVPGQTSVEEAQHYLEVVASGIAQSLNSHFTQATKQDAIQKAQLQNGIEPRGGTPQLPSAKKYDPKKGFADEEWERDLIAHMKSVVG